MSNIENAKRYIELMRYMHTERCCVADFLNAIVNFDIIDKKEAIAVSYEYSAALDYAMINGMCEMMWEDDILVGVKVRR